MHTDYDNNFHPVGVLSEPLSYEEVAKVCSSLKSGISGVTLEYEDIRFLSLPFDTFYMNYTANFFYVSLFLNR